MKKYLEIFFRFFAISLFVVGGGYVIAAVAERVFSRLGWIKEGEVIEHLPVFQMIPGIIAAHTAVYVGSKRGGVIGAAVALCGATLPSIVVFTIVSLVYESLPLENTYIKIAFLLMRLVLIWFVISALVRSWRRIMKDIFSYCVFVAVFTSIFFFKFPVILSLAMAAISGIVFPFREQCKSKHFQVPAWMAFLCFLQYSFLGFGGGFSLVPMYLEDFVGPDAPFLQITIEEFSSIISLTQITPGPIGVNAVTFFGFRLYGLIGALVASFLLLFPSAIMSFFAFRSLEKFKELRFVKGLMCGIRPASLALMMIALIVFGKSIFLELGF